MKNSDVPQDNASTYANNFKAIYAVNENGEYVVVPSSGWEVEATATLQALRELERKTREAHEQVRLGLKSPLYYHMYNRRMDLQVLSETTATAKWRIRRHFRPDLFARLSRKQLERYANALGITMEELLAIPEQG